MESGAVEEILVRNQTEVIALYTDGTRVQTTKPADLNLLTAASIVPEQLEKPLLYRKESPNPLWRVLRGGALVILPLIAITALYIFYIGRVNAAKAREQAT